MKFSDRLNKIIHPVFANRLCFHYRQQLKRWERQHPESFGRVDDDLKRRHIKLWSRLMPSPYDGWLRLLTKLSGTMDYRFVPADVYYSVIERCLNDCNATGSGIDDKNYMGLYIPCENLPRVIIRYVRGVFFDEDFNAIPMSMADDLLKSYKGDVVGKPASDTCGGTGVILYKKGDGGFKYHGNRILTAKWIADNYTTFIVQERIVQETTIAAYNPASVNTCRIVTFRRPWNGEVSVMSSMLRLGCGNEIVDNISSGGCCVDVAPDGALGETGVDYNFGRVFEHRGSHITFAKKKVPYYVDMCEIVCRVAKRIPEYNIMGFDVVADEHGKPKILEVNTTSIASVMVQMRRPLFGDETERVVEWCKENSHLDFFRHFRTFY